MSYHKKFHTLPYVIERFEAKYIPEPNSGCWLWEATTNLDGYGRFRFRGLLMGAHRFSMMLYKEQENKNLCVLHRCDNPCCVNPDHLFFGTHLENMRDRAKKGRGFIPALKGEAHYNSKFKEVDILDIREYSKQGLKNPVIAKKYGVCTGTIQRIISGGTWKHVK